MTDRPFVHLHNHTEYSLLDGMCRVKDLAKKAKEDGQVAVALTDHGSMSGIVEFYTACKDVGIKPILGCEVYTTDLGRTRFQRDSKLDRSQNHLVLLAENETGYRNLLKMVSLASLEGFYYKPRVDADLLQKYNEGLIASSACLGGEIPQAILDGDLDRRDEILDFYRETFPGRFYLELQDHGLEDQRIVNERLIQISERFGLPLIVANDAHYLNREDAKAHDVLLAIQTNAMVDDPNRFRFGSDQFYFKTREEMYALFPGQEQACRNTLEIAERCNLELDFRTILPAFPIPDGHTYESYLEEMCRANISRRYPEWTDKHETRLRYELGVIQSKGFSAYFLIVQDFVNWAKGQGIISQARGSGAGCVVSYLLGISAVEPLYNDLMFERFLRVDGKKMPDIDVDFEDTRRDEVLRYVVEKYGKDRVAQIATFGTFGAKAAVRDVGRALGIDRSEVDRISKMIPTGLGVTLENTLASVYDLQLECANNADARNLVDTAQGVEGLRRHASTHAAAVVIGSCPLADVVPLMRNGENPLPTTQWDYRAVEKAGLLKMDFLGVAYLTVCSNAFKHIEATTGEKLSLDDIPLDDVETYDLLTRGEGIGVFQVESSGMRGLLRELKPREFLDLCPLIALYRPGPLQSGMVQDFIARRHGRAKVEYPHPMLEPILKDTYGILIYQEQVMKIAMAMGGFDSIEAEGVMKSMSKKDHAAMERMEPMFIAGAVERGINADVAKGVWDTMANFASYGFNRSHSSAYSLLLYQTAWLKVHYPAQYMAALLTSNAGDHGKIALYVDECRRMGIEVLHPDVNESLSDFRPVQKDDGTWAIRFALGAIKSAHTSVIDALIAERSLSGRYKSLFDFSNRVNADRTTLENLIRCGAFDTLHDNRRAMVGALDVALKRGKKGRKEKAVGQMSLLDMMDVEEDDDSLIPAVPEYHKEDLLEAEKDLLGFYLTDHPINEYTDMFMMVGAHTTQEVMDEDEQVQLRVGGLISRIHKIVTKKGDPMCFLSIEDRVGKLDVVVFPKTYKAYGKLLHEGIVVLIEGTVSVKETAGDDEDTVQRQVSVIADMIEVVERPEREEGLQGMTATETPIPVTKGQPFSVQVPMDKMKEHTMIRLRDAVLSHPGDTPVHIYIGEKGNRKLIEVGSSTVSVCQELVDRVTELLGEGNVRY